MPHPPAGDPLPAPNLPPLPAPAAFLSAGLPAAHARSMPTIPELWYAFKRRWVLAAMIGGVLAAAGAAAVWMAMPSGKHMVQATLQFKSTLTDSTGEVAVRTPQDQFDVQIDNHRKMIETKPFLSKVAADPEVARLPMIAEADDKAQAIKAAFVFKRESFEIVTLTLNGNEPDQMQVILRVLVAKYIQEKEEETKGQRRESINQLNHSIDDLDTKIKKARDDMKVATNAAGRVDATTIALKRQEITTLAGNKQKAREEKDRLELERDQAADHLKNGKYAPDPADVKEVQDQSLAVMDARKLLATAVSERKKLDGKLKPNDPSLKEADETVRLFVPREVVGDLKRLIG